MYSTVIFAFTYAFFHCAEEVFGQSTDPCINPISIGSSGKRSINYDPGTCESRLCDNYIRSGSWYTLDGETSGNRMPESCVPAWRCGTYMPIWMNGAHPTADSPGPVTVSVCAQQRYNDDCCAWRDQIKVKFCNSVALGDYYVYQLKAAPFCDMAYCGGSGVYCGTLAAWNEITANCTSPKCPAISNVVLSDPFISETKTVTDVNGNSYTARRFSLRCSFNYNRATNADDGARFDVVFEAEGQGIAKFTLSSSSSRDYSAVMDESYLSGFLDGNVRCRISAYWQSSHPQRCSTPSRAVYYGIQVLDQSQTPIRSINIQEGERKIIYFRSTFPVTSPGCLNLLNGARCNPSQTFRISSKKILLSNCSFQLSYENPTSIPIVLSPIPTIETVYGAYVWPLNFAAENSIQAQGSAIKGYKSTDTSVSITDDKTRPVCRTTTDPNIYTFPKPNSFHYVLVRAIGDFYLVRLTERNLEIQVRQTGFMYDSSYNCGVMVREGNNVVGIDMCSPKPSPVLVRYLVDQNNPGGEIVATDTYLTGWKIKLPSGVEINVLRKYWTGAYLDIIVNGLAVELNSYTGLCTYNGVGNYETECDRLYRVAPQDSLFQITSANPPKCKDSPVIPACDCGNTNSQNVPCFVPNQSNLLLTSDSCTTTRVRRKRDDTGSSDLFKGGMIDVDTLNNTILDGFLPERTLTWPTPSGITERTANETCTSALRSSPAYNLCRTKVNDNFIFEACRTDIKASDSWEFLGNVPVLLEALCLNAIDSSFVISTNDSVSNDQSIKDREQFEDIVCPEACNQKGTCSKGVCQCNPNYSGSTCNVDRRNAPAIQRVWSSLCDVRNQSCTKIILIATGASNTELICKIRKENNVVSYDISPSVEDKTVVCNLPSTGVNSNEVGANASTSATVYVSLSNDKNNYTAEIPFTIYDGLCVACSSVSDCSLKTSTCGIDGRCYSAGHEQNCTMDLVISCKPSICQNLWSTGKSAGCKDGYKSCLSSSAEAIFFSFWLLSFAGIVFRTFL